MTGFKFYDKNNTLILEVGDFDFSTKEINLEENDRIVGIESRLYWSNRAWHESLVFVTARKE